MRLKDAKIQTLLNKLQALGALRSGSEAEDNARGGSGIDEIYESD